MTTNSSALVPGCGSGYDCLHLSKFGYSNVVGLDVSETAVKTAAQLMAENPDYTQEEKSKVKFQVADFFTIHQGQYDLIFDYLFFSAIDLKNREDWARGKDFIFAIQKYLIILYHVLNARFAIVLS